VTNGEQQPVRLTPAQLRLRADELLVSAEQTRDLVEKYALRDIAKRLHRRAAEIEAGSAATSWAL
jgi:hypothetical protein